MRAPSQNAPPRWAVVINASAGRALYAEDTLVETLHTLFHENGIEVEIHLVPGPEIESTLHTALRGGVDGIAAGGGDGTISTIVGVLAGSDVPLAVLPLGTLNHFAKDLGIPLSLPEAVRVIAEGHRSWIDLGEVNGEVFINNSSIGGYPEVILSREHQRRHLGRHKWMALAVAFFRFLKRFKTMKVVLHLDGKEFTRKTPFVFVGNNEYVLDQTLTAARRNLTDGRLCVYTARCDHWMQFLRLFGLLLVNRLADAPEFEAHFVSEARIQTRRSQLHVSRDGEISTMVMPLQYRIRTRALTVILPLPEPTP